MQAEEAEARKHTEAAAAAALKAAQDKLAAEKADKEAKLRAQQAADAHAHADADADAAGNDASPAEQGGVVHLSVGLLACLPACLPACLQKQCRTIFQTLESPNKPQLLSNFAWP